MATRVRGWQRWRWCFSWSGVVVEVGDGVTRFAPGDHVVTSAFVPADRRRHGRQTEGADKIGRWCKPSLPDVFVGVA
jgi:NADPH:quinone reductase-like Zn-dependent oxidoreductase